MPAFGTSLLRTSPGTLPAVRTGDGSGTGGHLARILGHLFSFELVFLFFLYSNEIKMFFMWLPVDETVLFGALSVVTGLWILFRRGIHLPGLPILMAAALLIFWIVLSYGWTPSRLLARKTLLYILTFNVWCVVAGALIVAAERERAVRFFVFSLVLAVVLAVTGLYIDSHFGSFRYWQGWRELGVRRVYLGWGYTIADGAGVLLALTLFARFGTLRQLTAAAGLAVCLSFLLVGGARGPFLGVMLAAVVAVTARPPRIGRYRLEIPPAQLLGVLALVLGGAAVLYLLGSGEAPLTLQRLHKALAMAFEEDARAPISLGADRLDYWPAAVAAWLEAPFAGHGISGFNVWYRGRELEGAHPHNILLQTLAELGLVGFALLLLFFWSGLRNVRLGRLREDPLFALALIFFVTGIMNGMFAKDLAGARKAFFVVGLLALAPPVAAVATPSPTGSVVRPRPSRSAEPLRRPVS